MANFVCKIGMSETASTEFHQRAQSLNLDTGDAMALALRPVGASIVVTVDDEIVEIRLRGIAPDAPEIEEPIRDAIREFAGIEKLPPDHITVALAIDDSD